MEYFEIDLGHKKVYVRKWKSSDRKLFKIAMYEETYEDIVKILVTDCVKGKTPLTSSEIEYLFFMI